VSHAFGLGLADIMSLVPTEDGVSYCQIDDIFVIVDPAVFDLQHLQQTVTNMEITLHGKGLSLKMAKTKVFCDPSVVLPPDFEKFREKGAMAAKCLGAAVQGPKMPPQRSDGFDSAEGGEEAEGV
jgi:hypothetical protein